MVNLKGNKVEKPWGSEIILTLTPKYAWKILCIKKGHRLSLQYHDKKCETLMVCGGKVKVTLGGSEFVTDEDSDVIEIPPQTPHRLEALEDTVIFEVSTPELNDVVRLADDYGRECKKDGQIES